MPESPLAKPIDAACAAARPPLSIDEAVRAALRGRPDEARSFGNEDDVEGPRPAARDELAVAPTL